MHGSHMTKFLLGDTPRVDVFVIRMQYAPHVFVDPYWLDSVGNALYVDRVQSFLNHEIGLIIQQYPVFDLLFGRMGNGTCLSHHEKVLAYPILE